MFLDTVGMVPLCLDEAYINIYPEVIRDLNIVEIYLECY